jgi:hypothetical protein
MNHLKENRCKDRTLDSRTLLAIDPLVSLRHYMIPLRAWEGYTA